MFFEKTHPLQLWAWIKEDGSVVDVCIINTDVDCPMPPKHYRMLADHEDLELLESLQQHILEGRIRYHGKWRQS